MQKSRLVSQKPTLLFFIIQGRGGGSRLIQYKDASGGRKKNATTMTTSSSCGRLTRRWFSWMARRGAKGEIVRDRTCVFCLSATHVNRAAMNKRDRFFGWMNTLFFLSFPLPYSLFPLPFSLSFENENWLESRFSRCLIKVGKLCGIMYVSLYWIFTPRDENADVRFSANTWHDRKEKRTNVENVA